MWFSGVLEIRRLEHVIFIRILFFPAETQSCKDLCGNLKCEEGTVDGRRLNDVRRETTDRQLDDRR